MKKRKFKLFNLITPLFLMLGIALNTVCANSRSTVVKAVEEEEQEPLYTQYDLELEIPVLTSFSYDIYSTVGSRFYNGFDTVGTLKYYFTLYYRNTYDYYVELDSLYFIGDVLFSYMGEELDYKHLEFDFPIVNEVTGGNVILNEGNGSVCLQFAYYTPFTTSTNLYLTFGVVQNDNPLDNVYFPYIVFNSMPSQLVSMRGYLYDNVTHDTTIYTQGPSIQEHCEVYYFYFNDSGMMLSYVRDLVDEINFGTYVEGYNVGYSEGYSKGTDVAYSLGYTDGFTNGVEQDTTVYAVFNGILTVAMVPVNFFLSIFNFEILGINLASFVSALLSVMVVIIIVRVILGGKGGQE